jgi:sporulation protein YlmC with PRC-barrel domain
MLTGTITMAAEPERANRSNTINPNSDASMPASTHVRSSYVIGATVKNMQGDKLGDIKELVFDVPTGKITYAALDFGGFLGIGDKLFAVPWNQLQERQDKDGNVHFVMNVTKTRLQNAPGFDKNHWPDFADQEFGRSVTNYYAPQDNNAK